MDYQALIESHKTISMIGEGRDDRKNTTMVVEGLTWRGKNRLFLDIWDSWGFEMNLWKLDKLVLNSKLSKDHFEWSSFDVDL